MSRFMMVPCLSDIAGSAKLAEKYGCAFEYGDFVSAEVLDDKELTNELVEKAKRLPFSEQSIVHGAFFDVTIFSSDARIREVSELRVRQSMDVARRLNARGAVFHTNYIPTFRVEYYENAWVEDNRNFWIDITREYPDLEIYMENMFDLEPALLLRLAQEMSGYERFGVCLDVAHAHLSPVPIQQWIAELAPFIKHMHINDNDGIADGHLPLGQGNIDFGKVFSALSEHGLTKTSILLEVAGLAEQQRCFDNLQRMGMI